jgi:hypothetical protein
MEHEGVCTINYEGSKINSFNIHKYYRQLIMKNYKIIEDKPEYPFPELESYNFSIDNNWLEIFNVQSNFLELSEKNNSDGKVGLIKFEEGIPSILVPLEILNTNLFDITLKKVHLYLRNQNNFAYLGRYLRSAFSGNEMAVKNMLDSLIGGPSAFKDYIRKPSDFAFQFFSYLCNKVLKDIG